MTLADRIEQDAGNLVAVESRNVGKPSVRPPRSCR
jgi:hypothetical protein